MDPSPPILISDDELRQRLERAPCRYCGKSFRRYAGGLANHERQCPRNPRRRVPRVQTKRGACQYCGELYFIDRGGLKRHERFCPHNPKNWRKREPPVTCPLCQAQFADTDALARHRAANHPPHNPTPPAAHLVEFQCTCGGPFAEDPRQPGVCVRCTGAYSRALARRLTTYDPQRQRQEAA